MAREMLKSGFYGYNELLRRLPIVCIEDSEIPGGGDGDRDGDGHAFVTMVFLMLCVSHVMSGKEKSECDRDRGVWRDSLWIEHVLGFVWTIAVSPTRYAWPVLDERGWKEKEKEKENGLAEFAGNAVATCLAVRARFGGMGGDLRLLRSAAKSVMQDVTCAWSGGGAGGSGSGEMQRISMHGYGPIASFDVPFSAVDQHCSGVAVMITDRIKQTRPQEAQEDAIQVPVVEQMLWVCRSRVSTKTLRTGEWGGERGERGMETKTEKETERRLEYLYTKYRAIIDAETRRVFDQWTLK